MLLVHPGGPFWQSRDLGAWSVPKGEFTPDEDPLDAARREFVEETGVEMSGDLLSLVPIRQLGGKTIDAWAVEGDCDPTTMVQGSQCCEWSSARYGSPMPSRVARYRVPKATPNVQNSRWLM